MSPQSSDQGDGEAGFEAGGEFSLGPFSARAEFSSNPADSDESDENGGSQLAENSREEESVTSESQAEQTPPERDSGGSGVKDDEWRSLSDEIRLEIADDLDLITRERYQQGSNRFGDRFQGDPIDHAVEEGVDSLFYLEMARRERANLIERIEMLMNENKQLLDSLADAARHQHDINALERDNKNLYAKLEASDLRFSGTNEAGHLLIEERERTLKLEREVLSLRKRNETLRKENIELNHQFNISDTADDLALINSLRRHVQRLEIQLKDAYRTSAGGEEAGLKVEYTEGDDGSYSNTYTDDTGVTHTLREDEDGYKNTVSVSLELDPDVELGSDAGAAGEDENDS